jgi:hypothetical protein
MPTPTTHVLSTTVWGSVVLFAFLSLPSQLRGDDQIERTVSVLMRLCVGGGKVFGIRTESNRFSLESNKGSFTIEERAADGLVDGINNALNSLSADQANRVRECTRPYIEQIMALILPPPRSPLSLPRPPPPPLPYDPVSTVTAFYYALSRPDLDSINFAVTLVVPEKRGSGNFNPSTMLKFYSENPPTIISIQSTGDNSVHVRYRFPRRRDVCDADAETTNISGKTLIRRISANC